MVIVLEFFAFIKIFQYVVHSSFSPNSVLFYEFLHVVTFFAIYIPFLILHYTTIVASVTFFLHIPRVLPCYSNYTVFEYIQFYFYIFIFDMFLKFLWFVDAFSVCFCYHFLFQLTRSYTLIFNFVLKFWKAPLFTNLGFYSKDHPSHLTS